MHEITIIDESYINDIDGLAKNKNVLLAKRAPLGLILYEYYDPVFHKFDLDRNQNPSAYAKRLNEDKEFKELIESLSRNKMNIISRFYKESTSTPKKWYGLTFKINDYRFVYMTFKSKLPYVQLNTECSGNTGIIHLHTKKNIKLEVIEKSLIDWKKWIETATDTQIKVTDNGFDVTIKVVSNIEIGMAILIIMFVCSQTINSIDRININFSN